MKKLFKIPPMLFLFGLFVLISAYSVSAASTVYVSAAGSDSNAGTRNSPYLTIGKGIDLVDKNGTVYIADGIYSGSGNKDITIDKSMTITGQSQKGTIINGTGTNRIFLISSGVNVTIQNLTLINGSARSSGAINNKGNLTVFNCTLDSNTATNGDGKGGFIYNYKGTITMVGCTFTGNKATYYDGGVIYNYYGNITAVNGCTFINNSAGRWGGAVLNDHGIINAIMGCTFINNTAITGGAIYNSYGTVTSISSCTFTGSAARTSGGAIFNNGAITSVDGCIFTDNKVTNYYGGAICNYGSLTISGSAFTSNTALSGGAIYNYGGDITSNIIKFSRIIGNTGNYDIYSTSGTLNAENNWWGTNFQGTNPQSAGRVNNNVYADPWIKLSINTGSVTTNTVISNVSANLRYNSNNEDTLTIYGRSIPDVDVTFAVDTNGNINPLSGIITNGQNVTTLFTATHKGTATINATVDGFTLSQVITINNIAPVVTGDSKTTKENMPVNGSVRANDADGDTLTYILGTGPSHGNVTVNGNGSYIYTPNSNWYGTDTFTITVNDGDGGTATATVTITVNQTIADVYLKITSSNKNPKMGDTFLLTYKLGNNGPDEAKNVTIIFQIPEGLEYVNLRVDKGTYIYNETTRTVIWKLDSVPVGDLYLYLTVKAADYGTYKIIPSVVSATYNSGSVRGIIIRVLSNNNENRVNAASKTTKTIGLQETGVPLNYLILAILMVLGGLVPKRK